MTNPKARKARENYLQGYNCAQAMMLAFAPDFGLGDEEALKVASPFGGGMGGQREVCGTVSCMCIICGHKYGYTRPKDAEAKAKLFARVQELTNKFKKETGTILCRQLLGIEPLPCQTREDGTPYKKMQCADIVHFAAKIMEDYLTENK